MEGIVVFGTGEIAALACRYFEWDSPHQVAAFTVDAAFVQSPVFLDRPVVSFEDVARDYPPDRFGFFVALAYSQLNRLRAARVAAARALGYRLVSYVSTRATTFPDLSHGENCFILEDNTIQPFVRIGHNVTLWSGNHIGHHSTIEDDAFISSHVVVSGGVRVGRGCFLGVNSTIRDHVTLGEECVVGAGALVLEDQGAHGVIAPRGTERSPVPSTRLRRI
ncbi:acetyltransferase [Roseococcus sp. YIM B11640]|uniref:acetyltransferase n=1 Tax=Roseococcus sp. YIM B11640 TaxID=3133973 RepID=UPI003C7CD0FF